MSERVMYPIVRFEPLAAIQESIFPLFHAWCWVDQEWSSEPSHCASSSPLLPHHQVLVALSCQGYCRPLPLGWLKTLLPPAISMAERSPKPRTPFIEPK